MQSRHLPVCCPSPSRSSTCHLSSRLLAILCSRRLYSWRLRSLRSLRPFPRLPRPVAVPPVSFALTGSHFSFSPVSFAPVSSPLPPYLLSAPSQSELSLASLSSLPKLYHQLFPHSTGTMFTIHLFPSHKYLNELQFYLHPLSIYPCTTTIHETKITHTWT